MFLLMFALFLSISAVATSVSVSSMRFQLKAMDRRLDATLVIKVSECRLVQYCAFYCVRRNLLAFNYDERNALCELFDVLDVDGTGFQNSVGVRYYELGKLDPNPCTPNPCMYNGTCKPRSFTEFVCYCPVPMGGKTCSELTCEVDCYRDKDLIIFLYNRKPINWLDSYNLCASKGLSLLLDKDNKTHNFVKNTMLAHYKNNDAQHAYWIGLNRTSTASKTNFKWIDGEVMGSFRPWSSNRPQGSLCVEVANGIDFLFDWDDDQCEFTKSDGWTYYALCYSRYPFLA